MRDRDVDPFPVVMVVLGIVMALIGAWVSISAPCEDIGWMPVKDIPARCLGKP